MKRLLFLVHRWGGVALALFMALWFLSGLIIVFAEPPTPTRAQSLAHAELLSPQAGWLSAGEAWDASASRREELARRKAPAGTDRPGAATSGGAQPPAPAPELAQARLVRQAGEPVWIVEDTRGRRLALSALDGAPHSTTPAQAVAIARSWVAPERAPAVRDVETLDRPAILRNGEALRPFHRVALEDGAGGELLVSAVTGEVVGASTSLQRALYWTGSWVHLFRPLELLGATNDTRVTTLEWTAFLAVVACLTGLVVGWLRWRPGWLGRPRYARGGSHPYRERWWRWHFWAGLVGGALALAWAVSGFLSNNPWHLFSPATPGKDELARYVGAATPGLARSWRPEPIGASADACVVELQWARVGDATVLLAHTRDGRRLPQPAPGASAGLDDAVLTAAVRRLSGGVAITGQHAVVAYDGDYYLRHHRDATDRPLPAVRVDLADAARTRIYLDPQDGRVLLKTDRSRRAFRWLYSALHHWDFGFLYRRPLWDAWMVSWIGLGLLLSVSSVVLAWRRVALTARRVGRRAGAAPATAAGVEPALGEELEAG